MKNAKPEKIDEAIELKEDPHKCPSEQNHSNPSKERTCTF